VTATTGAITIAGSFSFCCLHHAASPKLEGPLFLRLLAIIGVYRVGVTPFGVTALARGTAESSCALLHDAGILSGDRNKRAKTLFNKLNAGYKMK
jgi:hypothetical protein